MTVKQGEIYGFLGPNGAGKTTALKLMLGLLRPTAGAVEVMGLDVATNREAVLRGVGSMIEVPVFYEHLSAADNLRIHLAYCSAPRADVDAALTAVGLSGANHDPVSTFSLGMRQRLALARAIVHEPKLLLLDEPINGLDPAGIRLVRDLLPTLARRGTTIVVSSHILSEVQHIADTIGVIVEGRVVREVPLADIKAPGGGDLERFFFDLMADHAAQTTGGRPTK
jgi:ABC-2 type transport system ATP-binding protein